MDFLNNTLHCSRFRPRDGLLDLRRTLSVNFENSVLAVVNVAAMVTAV